MYVSEETSLKKENEAEGDRTLDQLDWNQPRYRCATAP